MQANCIQKMSKRQWGSLPQQACCSSTALLLRSQPLRLPSSALHLPQPSCTHTICLHKPQIQHASGSRHGIIAAAAAPSVVPAVSSAVASFPALQGALAPALPYVMAAAAACCAALVGLVSHPAMHLLHMPCWPRATVAPAESRMACPSWYSACSRLGFDVVNEPARASSAAATHLS